MGVMEELTEDTQVSGVESKTSSTGECLERLYEHEEMPPMRGWDRKRVRNENQWKRSWSKEEEKKVKAIMSATGKVRPARKMVVGKNAGTSVKKIF